jgi:hypothetical protein
MQLSLSNVSIIKSTPLTVAGLFTATACYHLYQCTKSKPTSLSESFIVSGFLPEQVLYVNKDFLVHNIFTTEYFREFFV